jgi:competence protein ComEC
VEAYFLDVSQGTSNVLLLGNRRAIVIDCGKQARTLLQLLKHLQVEHLTRLVISHNDNDHAGGAPDLLIAYRKQIDQVCFLQDRPLERTTFWQRLKQERDAGHLVQGQVTRLECDHEPRSLYRDDAQGLDLKIYAPTFDENLRAQDARNTNATSAVLILCRGRSKVVFPGDSVINQWRRIRQMSGGVVVCEILAVPHHAGIIWPHERELDWLYSEGVRPKFAVVSVGTSNTHHHPRREVIHALVRAGAKVLCTQITDQCCDRLESLRPGILPLVLPGQSRPDSKQTRSGKSRDMACAGTVMAEVHPDRVVIQRLENHQDAVNRLSQTAGGHPLCRSGAGSKGP